VIDQRLDEFIQLLNEAKNKNIELVEFSDAAKETLVNEDKAEMSGNTLWEKFGNTIGIM
jgi:hypothetical protein